MLTLFFFNFSVFFCFSLIEGFADRVSVDHRVDVRVYSAYLGFSSEPRLVGVWTFSLKVDVMNSEAKVSGAMKPSRTNRPAAAFPSTRFELLVSTSAAARHSSSSVSRKNTSDLSLRVGFHPKKVKIKSRAVRRFRKFLHFLIERRPSSFRFFLFCFSFVQENVLIF